MSGTISAGTRVLVTGGAGFIGSHLVERLVNLGANVAVVDDLSTGRTENLDAVASSIELDALPLVEFVRDPRVLRDFDVIFHLAANPYIPPSVENPAFDYAANLESTFRLLESLRTAGHSLRLVNTSSAAIYGNPARLPIRESDPTVPISPYGVSKLAAERYVSVYSQLYALPCSSVRLFSVYGPRQQKQVVYDLLDRVSHNATRLEVIGDGTQERDFIYVEDVAAALIAVAECAPAKGEVFNVASGSSHSIAQLVDAICKALGSRPDITYTGSLRPGDADRWSVDTSALRQLGYEARITLLRGLEKTRDWYLAQRRTPQSDAVMSIRSRLGSGG